MFSFAVAYERKRNSLETEREIKLRGNQSSTWVAPELRYVSLSVNALAFNICPTSRDLYCEYVQNIRRPPSWNRYIGHIIDKLYKEIFLEGRGYCERTPARSFNVLDHFLAQTDNIIDRVIVAFSAELKKIDPHPEDRTISALVENLKKIIRYEAVQLSAQMEFELSQLPDATPDTIFTRYFNFNPDFSLNSQRQGFKSPATPDFLLRDRIIGDVKYGTWNDYYEYTMVAYALAYEDHMERPIDLGGILQVGLQDSRPFPIHNGSRIEILDDYLRKRFLIVRDRKLQIIADGKDPGLPDDRKVCEDLACYYINQCWGK